jgi:hypothetical protein
LIKKLKSGIRHRKARVFLIFLACSFGAWLISRLSQTYSHTVEFNIIYTHLPENRVLMDPPPPEMGVRIRANGFQLLGYQLSPRTVEIDLRNARETRKGSYISPQAYREQMERQLGQGIGMLQIPSDTIFMNFHELRSKTVPVRVQANLDFAQNYMLDGELSVEPDKVTLLGPREEIDSISEVHTEPLSLTDLKADFQFELGLEEPGKYRFTEFSKAQIRISGQVFRFSETVVEVPVEVIGVPEGIEIQTFPEAVGVLCKGRVAGLKELRPEDFHLVADYSAPEAETGRLMLSLAARPEGVYQAQLLEPSVEFIIKRE